MNLSTEIISYIEKCVLCWLATVDQSMQPNVSPKEVFSNYEDDKIIIANIASPNSAKNIKINKLVCISFVDILVQKGFQLKGSAEIIDKRDPRFAKMNNKLLDITKGKFPFKEIILIQIESSKKIVAPSYILYPDTKESEQIKSAKIAYGLHED